MELHFLYILILSWISLIDAYCRNGVYERSVTSADRRNIVYRHNDIRNLIRTGQVAGQPRGYGLQNLIWDERLAAEAQQVADSCELQGHKVTDGRFAVGLNLYLGSSTGYSEETDWDKAIQSWFDQHKNYRYSTSYRYEKGVGSYTQLVWADTKYIGCGYTHFRGDGKWKSKKLYVCCYGPAGNVKGGLIYDTPY